MPEKTKIEAEAKYLISLNLISNELLHVVCTIGLLQ